MKRKPRSRSRDTSLSLLFLNYMPTHQIPEVRIPTCRVRNGGRLSVEVRRTRGFMRAWCVVTGVDDSRADSTMIADYLQRRGVRVIAPYDNGSPSKKIRASV